MLYENAIDVAEKHLLFRPVNPENLDILISGSVQINSSGMPELDPQGQHLVCFAAGMIAIASRIFRRDDLEVGRKLVDGCVWAYESTPSGIMPETFHAIPCTGDGCRWDENQWHQAVLNRHDPSESDANKVIADERLPSGFTDIPDHRYILRSVPSPILLSNSIS